MAQALPLLKLGGLLVKTVTKPMAQSIESRAKTNKSLGNQAAKIGQIIHQLKTRINVMSQGYKFVGAKPVAHDEAVAKGAKFLSETVIFIIAGVITTYEYFRSEREKEEKAILKEEKEKARRAEINRRLTSLEDNIASLKDEIKRKYENNNQNDNIDKSRSSITGNDGGGGAGGGWWFSSNSSTKK